MTPHRGSESASRHRPVFRRDTMREPRLGALSSRQELSGPAALVIDCLPETGIARRISHPCVARAIPRTAGGCTAALNRWGGADSAECSAREPAGTRQGMK